MHRRLFSWILAICIAFSLVILPAQAKESNETTIYTFLRAELGLNPATACGILANMYEESGFNPEAYNPSGYYGICQWGGERLAALKDFGGDQYNTLEVQLQFMKNELETNESNAWKQMQGIENSADGAYTAAYRWAQYYERCWSAHWDTRGNLAKNTYWPKYKNDNAVIAPTPTPTPKPTPTPTPDPVVKSFEDVPKDAYYADAVQWAVQKGVTNGTSDTTFTPSKSCTRAEMVTFLWRAAGEPKPKKTKNPFTDVSKDAYYYKAVLWAYYAKITKGTSDDTFSPKEIVNRGQTVTFLWRMQGEPEVDQKNPFDDVADGKYYTPAVLWAYSENVTKGTSDDAFSPKKACTRGQIVTFLFRAMGSAIPEE